MPLMELGGNLENIQNDDREKSWGSVVRKSGPAVGAGLVPGNQSRRLSKLVLRRIVEAGEIEKTEGSKFRLPG